MSTTKNMQGTCLCGKVSVTSKLITEVEACHCGMCQRWGGGPYLSLHCGPDTKIDGADNISVYPSSDWAERGFCKSCGTHIFYRLKHSGDYAMPAGLFEDQTPFEFAEQIFVDRKPGYYEFANQTRQLTEEEVMKKYAP